MNWYRKLIFRIVVVIFLMNCCPQVWSQEVPQEEETVVPFEEQLFDDTGSKAASDAAKSAVSRIVPDSVPARLKKDKAFAYANDASLWTKKKKKLEEDTSPGIFDSIGRFFQSGAVRAVFYVLIILAVIWIIYRLAVVNNLFVFSTKKKPPEETEEELTESPGKIKEKIEAAIRAGDYRLATRLLYIETLQWLDQLQLIRYQADATNQEYVQQMDKTSKGKEFRQLTRVFDYVWYGKFPVTPEKFELIRKNFKTFNQSARA